MSARHIHAEEMLGFGRRLWNRTASARPEPTSGSAVRAARASTSVKASGTTLRPLRVGAGEKDLSKPIGSFP
jgi:hypothetical protein